jgi:predicted neuraminidase
MIVELRDRRLWMLARTRYGIGESFSSDKGRTWSEPRPSALQNPSARFFIRRLSSGRLLLVKNGPTDRRVNKRSHMTAFLSDDDGKTWRGGLLLDERASVSYPDGFQAPNGVIHILYDWNRHTDAEILMAKFKEKDILAGKFVTRGARSRIPVNKATGERK